MPDYAEDIKRMEEELTEHEEALERLTGEEWKRVQATPMVRPESVG